LKERGSKELIVRVIAGKYRSRLLKGPGRLKLRPTSDRLRETLFNILGPEIADSDFWDLYAGTGAIGIEAISRGARAAIFVESHVPSARLVRENLEALDISGAAEVMEADVIRALEKLAARRLVADFIFLDPPYENTGDYLRVLEFLDASHLIAPYGIVIVEHHRRLELPDRLNRIERTRVLEQGDAALSFYRLAAAA
jgi:16S rRNA (guanine966-N2)-methyltransferase